MINSIEQKRKQRNMTQQELADLADVSRQTIISLERGKYSPSIVLAYKLSLIFDTNIEDLFDLSSELEK